MTSRLLAFILAMLIGSPTCWCCQPRDASGDFAEHSCCDSAQSACGATAFSSDAAREQGACVCAASLTKRDLAKGQLFLPRPIVSGVDFDHGWMSRFALAPTTAPSGLSRLDHGPPWWRSELYHRDCRLLL